MTKPKVLVQEVERFLCHECETAHEEYGPPLYECSTCGEFTRDESLNDNHQCPTCAKFGSKVAEYTCPDCNAEISGELSYIYMALDRDGNEHYYEKTLIEEVQEYDANNTPAKKEERRRQSDEVWQKVMAESEARKEAFFARKAKIERVLTECGDENVESRMRSWEYAVGISVDMDVFLRLIDMISDEEES